MAQYDRSKIYKIVCNITGKIYVGSTTEPLLSRRLAGHRSHYNSYLKGKSSYITSIEILKNENYYMELICNAACNSKDELNAIEGKYIREIDCVNKVVPDRTQKQYREEHAVELKKSDKKYREKNAEKIKQKHNCECGGKFTHNNKSEHLKSKKHQKYLILQLDYNII